MFILVTLMLELEIEGVAGVFTKYIQMDNVAPVINLQIDDMGDCNHYKIGDPITGSFSVYDAHLLNYSLSSSFGGPVITGPNNVSGTFNFPTAGASTPCGEVSLIAFEKTIYNSQSTNNYSHKAQIICLQPQS